MAAVYDIEEKVADSIHVLCWVFVSAPPYPVPFQSPPLYLGLRSVTNMLLVCSVTIVSLLRLQSLAHYASTANLTRMSSQLSCALHFSR